MLSLEENREAAKERARLQGENALLRLELKEVQEVDDAELDRLWNRIGLVDVHAKSLGPTQAY